MKVIIFLALSFLFATGNAQDEAELLQLFFNPFDSFEDRYLEGNIRSIRTIYSRKKIDGKRVLLGSPRAHLEEFNQLGKIISYYQFSDKPVYFPVTSQEKNIVEYWPNGELKKITWSYGRYYETFNKNGEKVGGYEWQGEFDSKDDFYLQTDSIINKYDASNLLISSENYRISDNSVEMIENTKFRYDQSGNIIKAEIFDGLININSPSNGKKITTMDYSYDKVGNLIEFVVESPGIIGNQTIFYTYQNGVLVKSLTKSDTKRAEINYKDGRITRKLIQYYDSGYTVNYNLHYQNDSTGNWVKTIVNSTVSMKTGGNPRTEVYYVNREIQYY